MSSAASASTPVVRRRPAFHFTPKRGWINDPIAGLQHGGAFHLYVQSNPDEPRWGLMRWSHLVSADLVTWKDHGIALAPHATGPDSAGCWSGSVAELDGELTFFYTGACGSGADHRQRVLRARPTDVSLDRLAGDDAHFVLADADRRGLRHQRDPFVVRVDGRWVMLLGTGVPGNPGDGAIVAWESDDGDIWRWVGVVFSRPSGDPELETGPVWECPQLVHVGDQWVLIVSVQLPANDTVTCLGAVWFMGDFDGGAFSARDAGLVDAGDVFYAPSVVTGTNDRCVLIAWLQESPATRAAGAVDYAGALSLPRELKVDNDHVVIRPAREVDSLWAAPIVALDEVVVDGPSWLRLAGAIPPVFRLRATVTAGERWTGVALGTDGEGRVLGVGVVAGTGSAPRVVAGEVIDGAVREHHAADVVATGPVALDVYVDASIIEVFATGTPPITFRVDPHLATSGGVSLVGDGRTTRFTGVSLSLQRSDRPGPT